MADRARETTEQRYLDLQERWGSDLPPFASLVESGKAGDSPTYSGILESDDPRRPVVVAAMPSAAGAIAAAALQAAGARALTFAPDGGDGRWPGGSLDLPWQVEPRGDPRVAMTRALGHGISAIAGCSLPVGGSPGASTHWAIVDSFVGLLGEVGIGFHRTCRPPRISGPVPAGVVSAWLVLDAIAAASRGVTHLTLGVPATMNLVQDLATVRTVVSLTQDRLARLHLDAAITTELAGSWRPDVAGEARSAGIVGLLTLTAVRAGAAAISLAPLVPTDGADEVTHAVRQAIAVRRLLRSQEATRADALDAEMALARSDAAAIIDAVAAAGDGDIAGGLEAAAATGLLGIDPHGDPGRPTFRAARDGRGVARLVEAGTLPLTGDVVDAHGQRLVADGERPRQRDAERDLADAGTPLEGWVR